MDAREAADHAADMVLHALEQATSDPRPHDLSWVFDLTCKAAHLAQALMSEQYIARRIELRKACEEMTREQGLESCDVCGRAARFEWVRTPAQRKKMSRRVRGQVVPVLPVAHRCSNHVPYFVPDWAECYRDVLAKPATVAA